MKKRRKLKKGPIKIFVFIILFLIIGISITKYIEYRNSYRYKLKQIGYDNEQIEKIETLSNNTKDYILTLKKNNYIVKSINQKYFMEKNLKKCRC